MAVELDCPLRNVPYSLDTPLMDLLLDPRAVEAIERIDADFFKALPGELKVASPPSLSAVYSISVIADLKKLPEDDIQRIAAELEAIPLTKAVRHARCERYDINQPSMSVPDGGVTLLVFEKTNGYRDTPSLEAAKVMLDDLARENDWYLLRTENGAAFTPELLDQFDAVIWNNVSGDVLTLSQRAAFHDYIKTGGGFVGLHGAGGDRLQLWEWYTEKLIGARFIGHPHDPQVEEGKVSIETTDTCLSNGVPSQWFPEDEWYAFAESPRLAGAHIIATVDEGTISTTGMSGADLAMGTDHPVIWTDRIESGRSFYSALGHAPQIYSDAVFRSLVENGIRWSSDSCARQKGEH